MEFAINTVIEGVNWPALPGVTAAARLSALFQIEQYQWWPQEKIRAHQFRQLDILLKYSVRNVPYYRDLLAKHITSQVLEETQWQDIPLLTRDALQQAGDSMHTRALPPDHGKLLLQRTSGSTGKPVEVNGTEITTFFWNVFTLRQNVWHRSDLDEKLAVIRHTVNEQANSAEGMHANNWGLATAGVCKTGSSVMLSIHAPIADQVAWLLKEQPVYLQTHPSVLQELVLHCQREGIKFPFLREVHTISEALPDGLRELCQQVWGVKLIDIYSTIELGYLALQCPEHEHYHVQSEGVLFEVLDEEGKPCSPGQVGKVVVTSLHNFATPLIRYEVGDYAEVGEPCSCGRGLPVIKRILGRYRNLVHLPNGERRWPRFGIGAILKIAPVLQFQAKQHSLHEVEFLLVVKRGLSEDEKLGLAALFRDNLHPEMDITITEVDEIKRSASGKYEEFVTKL